MQKKDILYVFVILALLMMNYYSMNKINFLLIFINIYT